MNKLERRYYAMQWCNKLLTLVSYLSIKIVVRVYFSRLVEDLRRWELGRVFCSELVWEVDRGKIPKDWFSEYSFEANRLRMIIRSYFQFVIPYHPKNVPKFNLRTIFHFGITSSWCLCIWRGGGAKISKFLAWNAISLKSHLVCNFFNFILIFPFKEGIFSLWELIVNFSPLTI